MAEVLLAHSYFLRFDPKAYRQMEPYAPLGTLYAASCVREHGYDTAFFDAMLAESELEIEPLLIKHKPRIVVFFEDNFNYLSKMCLSRMREACFRMAAIARRHGCIVIAQGSDPVDHLQQYFSNGIDYVICGEGEMTLKELLDTITAKPGALPLDAIQGIAYRRGEEVTRTPKRALIGDLDSLPFPAWDLIDIEKYRAVWKRKHGYFSMNIVTTRGCPFRCNWCAKPVYGQVYNSRSPANVAGEQKLLKEKYGAEHIWFADDIFGLKPGWVAEYEKDVLASGARLPFKIQSRVDLLLQEDTVAHLVNGGCAEVWVGAESGSQKILDAMDKGTTVTQIDEATRLLKKHGIHVAFFLQYGYTGETAEDIERTLEMVRRLMPDEIGISVSYPLPGTEFYRRVETELGRKKNWETSGDLDMMFPGTYSPAFYRALHTAAHKEFRLRQSLQSWLGGTGDEKKLRHMALLPWYAASLFWYRRKMKKEQQASVPNPPEMPMRQGSRAVAG